MSKDFYCPQPVLNMFTARRKGETNAQYGKRFEKMQEKFGKLLALREKLRESK